MCLPKGYPFHPRILASAPRQPHYRPKSAKIDLPLEGHSEAALRLRPDFLVASERQHFGVYLRNKDGFDRGPGLGDMKAFIKKWHFY